MVRARIGRSLMVLACVLTMLAGVRAGSVPVQHSAESAPGMVRIMPLGASSTVGTGSWKTAGYRGPLQWMLVREDLEVDLVGSLSAGPDSVPDDDHEGRSGITLEEMEPRVAEWVRKAEPHIVLLHNGTNDLLQGASPKDAAEHLEGVLSEIGSVSRAHVVVAGVWAPMRRDQRDREEFERRAAAVVAQLRERGHPLRFVDSTDLLASDEVGDGLHPNADGYRRIAELWEREILDVVGVKRPAGS